MALIEFKDLPDTTTPLNADNLNNNFNELDNKLNLKGSYAYFSQTTSLTLTNLTAWTNHQLPLSNASFQRSNTDFEKNGDYIKCNFTGTVLVYRYFANDQTGETDIIDNLGYVTATGTRQAYSLSIVSVTPSTNLDFVFSGAMSGDVVIYGARLIAVRLS